MPTRPRPPSASERHPPHRVVAGHGQIEDVLVRRQHQPVRARHVIQQQFEPAVGAQPVEPPARVVQPALALVGQIKIAVAGEHQIVQPLEALAARPVEKRLDLPRPRVEQHQALLVVGDEDAAVLVDLEAVGLAVIFGDEGELAAAATPGRPGRRGCW